jgi:pilus assembly protein CpaE
VDHEVPNVEELVRETSRWDVQQAVFLYHVRSRNELAWLSLLAAAAPGRPIIALVEGPDHSLLVAANRAGATQVVLVPFDRDDFQEAIDRVAAQFGDLRGQTRVIAVAGVTGGCGATTIAAALAYEVGHLLHVPCVLMELALPMGRLSDQFGIKPKSTTLDLIKRIDQLDGLMLRQALTPIGPHLNVLPGPVELIEPLKFRVEHALRLVSVAKRISQVVVVDVPCGYDDLYFRMLAAADQVVLIGEQRIPSIRSLRLVRGFLSQQSAKSHVVVVNRFDPTVEGFELSKLKEILKADDLATIRHDHAVEMASAHGRPLRDTAPRSRALAEVDALVKKLFVADRAHAKTPNPLLARLFRTREKEVVR